MGLKAFLSSQLKAMRCCGSNAAISLACRSGLQQCIATLSGCCSCTGYCVVLQSKFEDAEDAQGIIARGPEALQSQFSSGFSMVLNLLHTRSMEAARAFLQRSFDNYLGVRPPAAHAHPSSQIWRWLIMCLQYL